MFNLIKRGGKIVIGGVLLIFGVIGILLPLLPGIPFILIGGAIISPKFRHKMMEYFHKWKEHGIKKYEQFRKEKPGKPGEDEQ